MDDIPVEDLDILQEIEDDLASLAEKQEEFDDFVWNSALSMRKRVNSKIT